MVVAMALVRERRIGCDPNIGLALAVLLLMASQQSQLNAWIAIVVFGLVLGVAGHIFRSTLLIVTGILIVGGFSAYFAFGVGQLR
jgi:hypothetical protein